MDKTLLDKCLKASFLHSLFFIIEFDPVSDPNKDMMLCIERIKFVELFWQLRSCTVTVPKPTTSWRLMVVSNSISGMYVPGRVQ